MRVRAKKCRCCMHWFKPRAQTAKRQKYCSRPEGSSTRFSLMNKLPISDRKDYNTAYMEGLM